MINLLEIRGLRKAFGGFEAVRGLDLDVRAGVVFGFLGPNGAGKTTTIRVVAGILRPTAGTVRVGGLDVEREPEAAKRLVGLVPDRPYLYERLTGREFVSLVGGLHGLPEDESWRRAAPLLERFDLIDRAETLIEGYSLGMRQKIAVVAGLVHRPRLLVVDEPLVGLDPPAVREMKDLMRRHARAGGAVLMSTHLLEIAETTCDDVAIIDEGRLLAQGPTKELLHRRGGHLEDVFMRLIEEARQGREAVA
jgi:ABC-2 type transport system ATP-binding protein